MYRILGIINIVLLVVVTAPYWLRRLGAWLFPAKKIAASKPMKVLRAAHKPLGVCLLLLALVHGYLALGALRLHTGTLVGLAVVIAVIFGILFYRKKKIVLLQWHKRAVLLLVLLTLLHLLAPSALYSIFG